MKFPFSRWLPAIAENPRARRSALIAVGLTAMGVAAVAPGAELPSPSVDPVAAAAIREATSGHEADRVADPATRSAGDHRTHDTVVPAPVVVPEREPANDAADQPEPAQPDLDTLMPYGTQGEQSHVALTDEQWRNARAIVEATRESGLGERAAVIAVATALQESKLENLGHLGAYNDHDSQGLFQQRPSTGWGTPEQVTDPEYSTRAFLNGLRGVDRWWDLPLTDAAQRVQVSAYPFAYAQWERQAADIVREVWNG